MLITPPTFGIYILGLTMQWLKSLGGLEAVATRNARKAGKLYADCPVHGRVGGDDKVAVVFPHVRQQRRGQARRDGLRPCRGGRRSRGCLGGDAGSRRLRSGHRARCFCECSRRERECGASVEEAGNSFRVLAGDGELSRNLGG